jgi:hypothetical protein
METPVRNDRILILGLVVVALIGAVFIGRAIEIANEPPAFTCATTHVKTCSDTERWMTSLSNRRLVFTEPLPARLLSVEVRDRPSDQVSNLDDWVAVLTMEGLEPVLVACYYSSDDMVACDDP